MTWDDLYPYVLPWVPGCPESTVSQHIRDAAIEFCRRTGCWTRTLDPVTTVDGVATVALPLDEGQELSKLETVMCGELEYQVIDRKTALRTQRRGWGGRVCWTDERQELNFHPQPDVGTVVTVDAVLKPSITADGIDDDVGVQHAKAIAKGALASLLTLPAPWRDLQLAAATATEFADAIGRAAFNEMRGHGSRLARNGPPTF